MDRDRELCTKAEARSSHAGLLRLSYSPLIIKMLHRKVGLSLIR